MEYASYNQPDATSDPQESADEISFCNCENNACETPYQAEDVPPAISEATESTAERDTCDCRRIKRICRAAADRLANDWRQTAGKPCIKQTVSYRLDVCKDPEGKNSVDGFTVEKTKICTLRTALIAAAMLALGWGIMMQRLMKK